MTMPMHGKVWTTVEAEEVLANPVEEHTASSRWETCNCRTCQRKRVYLDWKATKE